MYCSMLHEAEFFTRGRKKFTANYGFRAVTAFSVFIRASDNDYLQPLKYREYQQAKCQPAEAAQAFSEDDSLQIRIKVNCRGEPAGRPCGMKPGGVGEG